jgi:hypothetical protein
VPIQADFGLSVKNKPEVPHPSARFAEGWEGQIFHILFRRIFIKPQ